MLLKTCKWLWFDVGIKRYTTRHHAMQAEYGLWFDVGIKRYTTPHSYSNQRVSCGLM